MTSENTPNPAIGTQKSEDDSAFDRVLERRRAFRRKIAEKPTLDLTYRIVVGVVGALVLVVGILAIPYPGPGWVIVFAGLGILASEFTWAQRALKFARTKYDAFMDWFGDQSLVIKALGVLLTTVVVLATLWLLGTFSLVGGWFGVDWAWLESPI